MPVRITDIPDLKFTALNQPTMDPNVAAAPTRELRGLAAEVAKVSEPFARLANQLQDVRNANLEADIEDGWRAEAAELGKRHAADPTNPEYLREAAALRERMALRLEQADVAPESRERLRPLQERLSRHAGIGAAETASRGILAEGRAVHERRMEAAVSDEDDGAIPRETERARNARVLTEQEIEASRVQAEARRSEWKTRQEIERDPAGWQMRNGRPDRNAPGFDEDTHALHMARAREVHSTRTLAQYYRGVQGIESGTLKPAEMEDFTKGYNPALAAKLEMLRKEKIQPRNDGRTREEVQNTLAGDVGARLQAYRRDGANYDGELLEMADGIRRMEDGPLKAAYQAELQDAVNGTPRHPPKTNAEYYRRALDREWEGYGFGRKKPPVHTIDVKTMVDGGLLRDRGKLREAGLSEPDIDYIAGGGSSQAAPGGTAGAAAVDVKGQMARFAERYGALKEKMPLADPFMQAVFTTLGAGRTVMGYTTPEEAAEAERQEGPARVRYGAALTEFTSWLVRNPDADEQKTRAAAEQAASAKARRDTSRAILRR